MKINKTKSTSIESNLNKRSHSIARISTNFKTPNNDQVPETQNENIQQNIQSDNDSKYTRSNKNKSKK